MSDLNQTRPEGTDITYSRGNGLSSPPSSAPLLGGDQTTGTRNIREPQQNSSHTHEQGEILIKTKILQALKDIEQLQF